jgi:hypothetical protein
MAGSHGARDSKLMDALEGMPVGIGDMIRWQQYPDITNILARKAQGRRERASLTFAEKLAILDKLKKDVEPIVRARRERLRAAKERSSHIP